MRILAIADIHGVVSVYEWLVELVEEYEVDLLLIAGDLFAADWEDGQREQARQIIPVLKRVEAPCFYIMGNDDNVALDFEDEQIKPLHGRRLSCGTYNLVGYQYTPPIYWQGVREVGRRLVMWAARRRSRPRIQAGIFRNRFQRLAPDSLNGLRLSAGFE
jgi:Icc-related predicted phosphoesterase